MPWEVRKKKGSKHFQVVKKDTGEVVATHATHEEAADHVKALYANTDEKPEYV